MSLCTFTGEEIALLQRGGNDVFRKTFCATMPHDVTRPVESNTESIKRWIEDVYVSKKYYKDVAASKRPPPLDTTESSDIAVIPLADVLGSDTPILRISMELGEKTYTDTPSTKETKVNDSKEEATEEIKKEVEESTAVGNDNRHHIGDEWDPFGVSSASPSINQSDSLLIEEGKMLHPSEKPAVSIDNTAEKKEDISFDVEWEAFAMEQLSSPEAPDDTPAPSPAAPDAYSNANSITRPEEELAKLDISHHNGAAKEQREEEPTRSSMDAATPAEPARPEVPLDAFYPEFSKIRETGILPTGAPVPWHMRPQQTMPAPPVVTHHAPAREETVAAPPVMHVPQHPEPSRASRQVAPTYDKATKTLFGAEKNLTAYDLSAQHAPKPNMTGNPFA